jgi:hypothetical protein
MPAGSGVTVVKVAVFGILNISDVSFHKLARSSKDFQCFVVVMKQCQGSDPEGPSPSHVSDASTHFTYSSKAAICLNYNLQPLPAQRYLYIYLFVRFGKKTCQIALKVA